MNNEHENTGLERRKLLAGLALWPLLGAAGAMASDREATRQLGKSGMRKLGFLPQRLAARERMRRLNLHNVELTTHRGAKVRFYDDLIKGRKVAINFMYATCDGICLPVTTNLVGVQRLLGDRVGRDIFFYSITLKPEEDSPAVLRDYARARGVGPGWEFLTGHPADIEALRIGLGFRYTDPEEDAEVSNHLGHVRLGVEPLARWGHAVALSRPEHILRSMRFEFDSPVVRNAPGLAA